VCALRITVLGSSPAWLNAGGACSGYLVEHGEIALVIDCGNGAFGKLREHRDYLDVDAVVLSHLHADHMLDLIPYSYALRYTVRQQPVSVAGHPGTESPVRPRLIAPVGAARAFHQITGAWGSDDLVDRAFAIEEYEPTDTVTVGALTLRFREVPHFVRTCAIEVRVKKSRKRFVFGADCAPNEALVEFAHAADLLFIEATLPRPERGGPRGHLTPSEAGDHGRRAGVRRLVLTHVPDELDEGWVRSEAEAAFGAKVALAREGDRFEL